MKLNAKYLPIAGMVIASFTGSLQASTLLLDTYLSGGTIEQVTADQANDPGWGSMSAGVVVGASNVNIDRFGLYSQQVADGNLRYDIFTSSGALIYDSGIVPTAAQTDLQWNYSPTMNVTLQANTTYYIGIISDQTFNFYWNEPAPQVDGLGLTALATCGSCARGANAWFYNFNDPTWGDFTAWVQVSAQVFGSPPAPVPIPASAWLFSSALASLGLMKKRNKTASSSRVG